MPPCATFFEAAVNVLWSLIGTAMTLVASLLYQPSGYIDEGAKAPAIMLASFTAAADVADLSARLRAADPAERVMAACELQRLGYDARGASAALVERLSDNSPVDPMICGKDRYYWSKDIDHPTTPGEEAAAALVAIGTDSLQPLIVAARAPQWVARRNAVWALGALHDRDAVPALVAALKDDDAEVRQQVAWALGAIRDARAVDALIAALKDSEDNVRSQAAWALGAIRDHRATDALTSLLKDPNPKVRRQAAWALGAIGR